MLKFDTEKGKLVSLTSTNLVDELYIVSTIDFDGKR